MSLDETALVKEAEYKVRNGYYMGYQSVWIHSINRVWDALIRWWWREGGRGGGGGGERGLGAKR